MRALHPGVTREQMSRRHRLAGALRRRSSTTTARPTEHELATLARAAGSALMQPVHVRPAPVPHRVRARRAVAGRRRGRSGSAPAHVMLDPRRDDRATPPTPSPSRLGARLALRWNEVAQHVPVELAERARAAATRARASTPSSRSAAGRRPGSPRRSRSRTACRSSPCPRPTPAASRRRSTG